MPRKVKELADAEAGKAEAEQPDEEEAEGEEETPPEGEPEPEPTPEPQATAVRPLSEKQQRQGFEREANRHEKKLRELIGSDFDTLAPCSHCFGLGFALPEPEMRAHEH